MSDDFTQLSTQKGGELFMLGMAQGMTISAASEYAGISRETGSKRWNDPEWRAAIDAKAAEIGAHLVEKWQSKVDGAIDRLQELSRSNNESVALGAARSLAEFNLKYRPGGEQSTVNSTSKVETTLDLSDDAVDVLKGLGIGDDGE